MGALASAALVRPRFAAPDRPRPSDAQLRWQQDELALFLHFGVNTFTDREWGDGREDPQIFAPGALDARAWARTARVAGFRAMILTAKHHDGFCLWPTRTTYHSVAASPFRGGSGDVVREFTEACRAEGLRAGLYCSPWDRNHPTYGDSDAYNQVYWAQLAELLSNYGAIAEVWFDGANGEGPNGRRQAYDWPRTFALVRRLQPHAVIFSDAGPDVRWIGNEQGVAGETCWSTIDPAAIPFPGFDGPDVGARLQRGDPDGTVWRPGETDVSIRPGWFWHAAEDARVRSVDNLMELYTTSVGRNSKLLLNVPPTRAGLLGESDVAALQAFRSRREGLYGRNVALHARVTHSGASRLLSFASPVSFDTAVVAEDIRRGQQVAEYSLHARSEGQWRQVLQGTTIGYKKIDRFPALAADQVRLTIDRALGPVQLASFALHTS